MWICQITHAATLADACVITASGCWAIHVLFFPPPTKKLAKGFRVKSRAPCSLRFFVNLSAESDALLTGVVFTLAALSWEINAESPPTPPRTLSCKSKNLRRFFVGLARGGVCLVRPLSVPPSPHANGGCGICRPGPQPPPFANPLHYVFFSNTRLKSFCQHGGLGFLRKFFDNYNPCNKVWEWNGFLNGFAFQASANSGTEPRSITVLCLVV